MTLREILLRALGPAPRPSVTPPAPGAGHTLTDEENLGRELLRLDWGLGLFRWVHLADAVEKTGPVSTAISFGSGEGLHEVFLARTRPDVSVLGVDLRRSELVDLPPNARFLSGDLLDASFRKALPRADLVYSIECLEHIEDDVTVARAMVECLVPGGHLYLQVPFASRAEQADPVLRENERRCFGHVRPGYDEEGLRALARRLDLDVVFIAGAFWAPLQRVIWAAVEKFGPSLAPSWRAILDLARLDLRTGLPASRTEAIAIKMLARKPA
ncbi:MAG TPA: class I SAM-dependent methyltransferase [Thermoanaerobaculia bacterium]|nr:class I SAM-dependent methyltransferase [Thermoanaerobaculia bacterium]